MERKNLFIAIEGVDGVGKTSITEDLADDEGFVLYKGPSGEYQERRPYIDQHASPLERWQFYRDANEYDSEQIRRLLEVYNVVADRYIASTYAYYAVMEPRIRQLHTTQAGILIPDYSFLIDANPDERDRRLRERGDEPKSEFLNDVVESFMEFDPKMIKVDTSIIEAKQAADIVRSIIKLYPDNE